jgi:hypothetical protein
MAKTHITTTKKDAFSAVSEFENFQINVPDVIFFYIIDPKMRENLDNDNVKGAQVR